MRPRLVPAPKIDRQSDDEILRRTKEFYETLHPCCGNGAERSKLAAMAFCGCKRSGGEATDSDRSGKGGEGILRAACAESVAGSASTTGHGFEQALPGNCAVVNRRFCTTVSNSNGRKPFANLLRD